MADVPPAGIQSNIVFRRNAALDNLTANVGGDTVFEFLWRLALLARARSPLFKLLIKSSGRAGDRTPTHPTKLRIGLPRVLADANTCVVFHFINHMCETDHESFRGAGFLIFRQWLGKKEWQDKRRSTRGIQPVALDALELVGRVRTDRDATAYRIEAPVAIIYIQRLPMVANTYRRYELDSPVAESK